jgi:predicted  nucleic acid-binding Zn-ribbon protein
MEHSAHVPAGDAYKTPSAVSWKARPEAGRRKKAIERLKAKVEDLKQELEDGRKAKEQLQSRVQTSNRRMKMYESR